MQLEPETRQRLHVVEANLHPDADTLARIRRRVAASAAEHPTPVPAPRRVAARRRRTLLGATASVALVGVGVWAAIAFAPDRNGDNALDAPRAAAAALNRAGTAAANAPWTPLAPGEFHRVYEIDAQVDTPRSVLDDEDVPNRENADAFRSSGFGGVSATETWFDLAGRGFVINAAGSRGYADEYPDLGAPDFRGEYGGWGFRQPLAERPERPVEDQLRYANAVDTATYPRDGRPAVNRLWLRAPGAYRFGRANGPGSLPYPGRTYDERIQLQYWGATYAVIDRVNDSAPAERSGEIIRMLDGDNGSSIAGEFQMVTPGTYGETERSIRDKRRVERAIKLLGRAPLSPAVRRTLFAYLARQSTARLDGDARDELGRTGTSVTFLTKFDERVPARTVTLDQIRREGMRRGFTAKQLATLRGDPTYGIPAHRERRTWYVRILFDTTTGELLQQSTYATARTDGAIPRAMIYTPGPLEVTTDADQIAGSGSTVYVARDRVMRVDPMSPVCENAPARMCAYDAGPGR